jgi:U3 small nucleolar RNA-associated protein 21
MEIDKVQNPTASGEGGANIIEAAYDESADDLGPVDSMPPTVEQLSQDLTSLSLVPRARWQTLIQLDLIRVRVPLANSPQRRTRDLLTMAPFHIATK